MVYFGMLLFPDHSINADFTRANDQQSKIAYQVKGDYFSLAEELPVIYFEKYHTHGYDQWDACKPCEQAQYHEKSAEEFSEDNKQVRYIAAKPHEVHEFVMIVAEVNKFIIAMVHDEYARYKPQ